MQHSFRVEVTKRPRCRRVILEPEGIEIGCIKSADIHVDHDRLELKLIVEDWFFSVDIKNEEETHEKPSA